MMKNHFKVTFTLLLMLTSIFFACSENSTEPQNQEAAKNYFPNKDGSVYKYDLEITDSLGATINVERTSTYSGTKSVNSKTYQVLVDNFTYPQFTLVDSAYFRKTETNLFYYADVSEAFQLIPDSLSSFLEPQEEATLLKFPVNVGDNSDVFKLILNYIGKINIIYVTANVLAKENVSLTVNSTAFNKEAIKIRFTMSIMVQFGVYIPYTADAWFVEDVGLVKLEGNSEAINFMIGNNLFYPGGYIKQTLKQYSIP